MAGYVGPVVEGKLEVFRALYTGLSEEYLTGEVHRLVTREFKVVIESVKSAAQLGSPTSRSFRRDT